MNERIERALAELRPALADANAERMALARAAFAGDGAAVRQFWAATDSRNRLERAVFALEDWIGGQA